MFDDVCMIRRMTNVVNFTVVSDDRILRVGKGRQRFLFLYQVIGTRRSVLVYGKPSGSYVHL